MKTRLASSKIYFCKTHDSQCSSLNITQREREVLNLISAGLSTEEIAQELFVARETVKSHRRSLLSKFEVRNAAQLVRRGFEIGILHKSLGPPKYTQVRNESK